MGKIILVHFILLLIANFASADPVPVYDATGLEIQNGDRVVLKGEGFGRIQNIKAAFPTITFSARKMKEVVNPEGVREFLCTLSRTSVRDRAEVDPENQLQVGDALSAEFIAAHHLVTMDGFPTQVVELGLGYEITLWNPRSQTM